MNMRTIKTIRAPLDDMKISGIHCELGTYVGKLLRYAEEKKAIKVVKAWGTPLFNGATFTVYHLGATVTTHTYAEIAGMFDVRIGKAQLREPAPLVVRKPVRVTRPPRSKVLVCEGCRGPYLKKCPRCVPAPMSARAPVARAPEGSAVARLSFIPADQLVARAA